MHTLLYCGARILACVNGSFRCVYVLLAPVKQHCYAYVLCICMYVYPVYYYYLFNVSPQEEHTRIIVCVVFASDSLFFYFDVAAPHVSEHA